MTEFFFQLLIELPDGPARKELNYKNLLAPTEFIGTISKFFSNAAMMSSDKFWDCARDDYSIAIILFCFVVVLDEISPQLSNQEKHKLDEYYLYYIRNFFSRRTFNVIHAAMDGYVNHDSFIGNFLLVVLEVQQI